MSIKYPHYATNDDRRCAKLLVDTILEKGYRIAIRNCEGIELKAPRGRKQTSLEVRKEMGATGIDELIILGDGRNEVLGSFALIYCDGCEGEPMELIADYVTSDVCEEIYRIVNAELG